ncbi:MAG: hypothetical protein ACJ78T_12675, partial [Myxococcales bacterium]
MSSTHLPTSPLVVAAREMTGSHLPARAAAFAALGLTLFLLSRGTVAAYYAFTDSFVAPIVLS